MNNSFATRPTEQQLAGGSIFSGKLSNGGPGSGRHEGFNVKKVKGDGGMSGSAWSGEDIHGSNGYARSIHDLEGTHHVFAFTPNGVQHWGVQLNSSVPKPVHDAAVEAAKNHIK